MPANICLYTTYEQ